MSTRQFTVQELKRSGSGAFVETDTKFVWTNTGRSSPRESWKFGLTLRTSRTDYPGSNTPVEQVLGYNFTPFTIGGVWDDRYNEAGFAVGQMRAFEAMVQRGGLVRVEFETVTIHGLITGIDFEYKREWQIGYAFTFSPHFRVEESDSGQRGPVIDQSKNKRGSVRTPQEYRDRAAALTKNMRAARDAFPDNQGLGDFALTIDDRTSAVEDSVATMTVAVNQRIDPKVDEFNGLRRIAASFGVIKGKAAELLTDAAALRSDTSLAWESAVGILSFDAQTRGLRAYAYQLALTSHGAQQDMNARVEPKAIAIYYPSKGESMYSISQRFYNTPTEWRRIASRNGVTTITLQGTEALIIPERR